MLGNRAYWAMKHTAWNGFTPQLYSPPSIYHRFRPVFSTSGRTMQAIDLPPTPAENIILYLWVGSERFPFFNLPHHAFSTKKSYRESAICYLVVATLYLISPALEGRDRTAWASVALIGYWLLIEFVPVRAMATRARRFSCSIATQAGRLGSIARSFLPRRRTRDPEGLLSTIPALGTALIGLLTGLRRTSNTLSESAQTIAESASHPAPQMNNILHQWKL